MSAPTMTCSQGAGSNTFSPPPLDRLLTYPEIYDWHSSHSAEHPLFVYSDESTREITRIRWFDAVQAVYRIANAIRSSVTTSSKPGSGLPVVGLFASTDTFSYILTMTGLLRAGFSVFLISTRTSPVALAHLISISGVAHVVVNEDDVELENKLMKAIARAQESDPQINVTISHVLPWSILFPIKPTSVEAPKVEEFDMNSLALILHSSGTTTLPKLNNWTHRMVVNALWQPWYGERDLCGQIMSCASIPMAGASGVMQALFSASSGLIISSFKPATPPTLMTPRNSWDSLVDTESTYLFVIPPLVNLWAQDVEKIKVLARLKGVIFGGGPLNKAVGDKLAQEGASLITFYGFSEAGLVNRVVTNSMGLDWEWFSFSPQCSPAFRFQEGVSAAELLLKACESHTPTKFNTEWEGVPAFATSDLLVPHPEKPGLWKYLCRLDDQEALVTGEKINAVAYERLLMADPAIQGAVIFSRGLNFGVIIEPGKMYGAQVNMTDEGEVSKFKEVIWPTIERYNDIAPTAARLSKETCLISVPDRPFVFGEKGMPQRKQAVTAYATEIEALIQADKRM